MNLVQLTPDVLESLGVGIDCYEAGGSCVKETRIPAGRKLVQHSHSYDHLSILASGSVEVRLSNVDGLELLEGDAITFVAPKCITIQAGLIHSVTAITDAVWYCVHASSDIDRTETHD